MDVLIACEESQRVCIEFRQLGHNAFSCDIQKPSGGHPEWHILDDVLKVLNPNDNGVIQFQTMDEKQHCIKSKWDLIIAHPPCTYLSNAGAVRLYPKAGQLSRERYQLGVQAKEFFMNFWNADCEKICIENPIPSRIYNLPQYSQIIQPYEYSHPYSKKTCLWLKNLPLLQPTEIVKPICSWVSGGCKNHKGEKRINCGTTFRDSKTRSKTFSGIAKAMAEQWGGFMDAEIKKSRKEVMYK